MSTEVLRAEVPRAEVPRIGATRAEVPRTDTSRRLLSLLNGAHVPYRLIRHAPEGRTDLVSELRGHPWNRLPSAWW